jgi:hypothetical protein
MYPSEVLKHFDAFLFRKGQQFEAIVIGGAALSILGIITRETRDVDVLHPGIPSDILDSSKEFARNMEIQDTKLKENWLNEGPESLRNYLRPQWQNRVISLFDGKAIFLQTLGRTDFIGTKVLAFCDRGFDLEDCLNMKPTKEELLEILPWVQAYDTNPGWPAYVEGRVHELAKGLGYGL